MSDFSGMEELLQDFLVEAGDLLSDVDNKLVDLERSADDVGLLNEIFRGFHTIKGGAGFLAASELVTLCHLTENLFDKLRNGELEVTPEIMDVILAATGAKGMPLVVEISVAFSILIAFIVIGIFLFRIRERFDTVDVRALDDFRGERQ